MNYRVVIVAAGQGTRMGAEMNKVLLTLRGIPVIIYTLRVFEKDPDCAGIVLVIRESERKTFDELIRKYRISKVTEMTAGGRERQESVYNGLIRLGDYQDQIVMIHDGARPFVTRNQIVRVAEAADRCGAALLAVRVKDTIKQVAYHKVSQTLERESLWAAQTPQAFRMSVIMQAHRAGRVKHFRATDDASLVEQLGRAVEVVEGSYRNIKLTTPEDMIIAEKFVQEEEKADANRPRV
ncbi:2-C-methyl-D-erythritol 4-phosphate cytidylyltransferase [Sporolactobacillus sp. KGMB 08714]|uniref:2-C-methyl-D-erythritol 4-phosphate cytidylyltransferase n=1 Tax=Sporolactobacillus sp. KGMB 08714 TaxID=3064704 RepID=UPI002FBDDBDC